MDPVATLFWWKARVSSLLDWFGINGMKWLEVNGEGSTSSFHSERNQYYPWLKRQLLSCCGQVESCAVAGVCPIKARICHLTYDSLHLPEINRVKMLISCGEFFSISQTMLQCNETRDYKIWCMTQQSTRLYTHYAHTVRIISLPLRQHTEQQCCPATESTRTSLSHFSLFTIALHFSPSPHRDPLSHLKLCEFSPTKSRPDAYRVQTQSREENPQL